MDCMDGRPHVAKVRVAGSVPSSAPGITALRHPTGGACCVSGDLVLPTGCPRNAHAVRLRAVEGSRGCCCLNTLLTEVLESEDYIRAIAIRDEIKSRGRN